MNTHESRRPVGLVSFGLIVLLVIIVANLLPVFASPASPYEGLAQSFESKAGYADGMVDQCLFYEANTGTDMSEPIKYFIGRRDAYREAAQQARQFGGAP